MFAFFAVFFHKKKVSIFVFYSLVFLDILLFLFSFFNICFSFFLFFTCPFWFFFGDSLWFDQCPFFPLHFSFKKKEQKHLFLFQFLLSPLFEKKKTVFLLCFSFSVFQKESPLSQTVTTVASPWQHTWMNPMLFGRVGGERCFRCGERKLSARRHPISRTRNQDRQGWWRHLAVARKRANRRRARTGPLWSPGRSRTASLRGRRRRRTLWTCASRITWLGFIKLSRHAPSLLPRKRLSRSSLFRCLEHGLRREKMDCLRISMGFSEECLLVGGSTRVPIEQKMIQEFSINFGGIVDFCMTTWLETTELAVSGHAPCLRKRPPRVHGLRSWTRTLSEFPRVLLFLSAVPREFPPRRWRIRRG